MTKGNLNHCMAGSGSLPVGSGTPPVQCELGKHGQEQGTGLDYGLWALWACGAQQHMSGLCAEVPASW